jgi:hypothetical protein
VTSSAYDYSRFLEHPRLRCTHSTVNPVSPVKPGPPGMISGNQNEWH